MAENEGADSIRVISCQGNVRLVISNSSYRDAKSLSFTLTLQPTSGENEDEYQLTFEFDVFQFTITNIASNFMSEFKYLAHIINSNLSQLMTIYNVKFLTGVAL